MIHPSLVSRFNAEKISAPTTQIFARDEETVRQYRQKPAVLCIGVEYVRRLVGDEALPDNPDVAGATLIVDIRCGRLDDDTGKMVWTIEQHKYFDSVRVLALAGDRYIIAHSVLTRNYDDVDPAIIVIKFRGRETHGVVTSAGDGEGTHRMLKDLMSFKCLQFDIVDIIPCPADVDYTLVEFVKRAKKDEVDAEYIGTGIVEVRAELDEIKQLAKSAINFWLKNNAGRQ